MDMMLVVICVWISIEGFISNYKNINNSHTEKHRESVIWFDLHFKIITLAAL